MTKKQFAEIICKKFSLKGITPNGFVTTYWYDADSETGGLSGNYKQKYSVQQQVIKDNYAIFG